MRPVLTCTHAPDGGPNLLTAALTRHGLEVVEANLDRDDRLAPLDDLAAVVSFGGQMSVLDIDRFPFLLAERELLTRAVEAGTPVLGICLGSQMLASASGGDVFHLPERYVDFPDLVRFEAADADPVFAGLPPALRVVEWHEDAVIPPPGAVILAETACAGCSIFRAGPSAWGTQLHLELDLTVLEGILRDPTEIAQLVESGVDPAWFVATAGDVLARQAPAAVPLLDRFAEFVVAREVARGAGSSGT